MLLYERVQAEHDLMVASLAILSDEAIGERIHEIVIKTLLLGLIVEVCHTQEDQDKPLEHMYDVFMNVSA